MTSSSTNSAKRGKVVGFTLDNINRKRGGWHQFFFFFWGRSSWKRGGGVPLFSGGGFKPGWNYGIFWLHKNMEISGLHNIAEISDLLVQKCEKVNSVAIGECWRVLFKMENKIFWSDHDKENTCGGNN